jgi:hypothetical protein
MSSPLLKQFWYPGVQEVLTQESEARPAEVTRREEMVTFNK